MTTSFLYIFVRSLCGPKTVGFTSLSPFSKGTVVTTGQSSGQLVESSSISQTSFPHIASVDISGNIGTGGGYMNKPVIGPTKSSANT